ncbi:MAG: metal ABC transporter permease [Bacteroidetes bacterium]|nr:MAG: metal ABC transporter permease [Bacteroidota bacterium]
MPDLFALKFVQSALLVTIIMGLLLAYLGTHVVGRGIVFVDLALGQISMLGVAVAAYFDLAPTTVSMVFTLVGAFLMSFIKVTDKRLKQEAIIGILYAVSSAATVLLISKAAHGDSDIQEVLFGSLFTVTNSEIMSMAIVFGILGIVHFIFRRQFFEITEKFGNREVDELGSFNLWNFLFYISIGIAIVLAVNAGGVIPVFSFLVIPPVSAILITRSKIALIPLALSLSVLGGFLGIYFSVQFDFPAGSSVVAMLGVLFALAAIVRLLRGKLKTDSSDG